VNKRERLKHRSKQIACGECLQISTRLLRKSASFITFSVWFCCQKTKSSGWI